MRVGICPLCGGETVDKNVEVIETVNGRWVIIKGVPAEVCTQCGERLYSENEMRKMEELREKIQNNLAKPIAIQEIEVFTV